MFYFCFPGYDMSTENYMMEDLMSTMTEVRNVPAIHVFNSEDGSSKPWQVKCADAGAIVTMRAAINFPIRSFVTREEAIEVASKISEFFDIYEVEEVQPIIDEEIEVVTKLDEISVRDPHIDYGDRSSASRKILEDANRV